MESVYHKELTRGKKKGVVKWGLQPVHGALFCIRSCEDKE